MSNRTDVKNPKTEKRAEKSSKPDKDPKAAKAAPARTRALTVRRDQAVRFYQDTKSELKKVTWPTRQQTINLTLVVIGLSIATGISLGLIDLVFSTLYRFAVPAA
ncbi:MAG: preprotein translocase subunit SecE [Chloroflexi bacterium]|nr:preprotein translocase subunit SecE [Chloroflexota bacterium]